MDTIIFLAYENEIYVGDYYKNKIKEVKFEKADSWEVYAYEDLEELIEYMEYPLQYNHFKDNRIIFLFDEIRVYEWAQKAQRLFKQSTSFYISPLAPFKEKLNQALEEKKILSIYEKILAHPWEEEAEGLRYEVILSPATLYTMKEKPKGFLDVQDVIQQDTLVQEGCLVEKGDELFCYTHYVQKLFGRMQVENVSKKAESNGRLYWYRQIEDPVWARKDELIGVIDHQAGTKEEMLDWCKKIL